MTAALIRRTQAERRRESELGLLSAAVDLIASEGVGALTFESLGRTSGFSRGLATQRFGSKQKLIEALLVHLHQSLQLGLADHCLDDLPGLDAVLTYIDVCFRNLALNNETRAYFMLLSSSVAELSAERETFRERHGQAEAQIRLWVVKGQAEGEIRPDLDPTAVALTIGCLLFGMSMQLLVDPAMDLAPIREMSLSVLRSSLTAH